MQPAPYVLNPATNAVQTPDGYELRFTANQSSLGPPEQVPASRFWRSLCAGQAESPEPGPEAELAQRLARLDYLWPEPRLLKLLDGDHPRLALTFATARLDAARQLSRRAALRVAVDGPVDLAGAVSDALVPTGVRVLPTSFTHDLTVLLAVGHVDSWLLPRLANQGVPHLPVRLGPDQATLGPFVVPGETPCWQCAENALEHLPSPAQLRPAGLAQAEHWMSIDHLVEPSLWPWALGIIVRDLCAYASGLRPQSWGVVLNQSLSTTPQQFAVPRDPQCSCTWTLSA